MTGTTGDPLCLDPSVPDEQIGPAVTVTIRNASDADVFVRGNGFCSDPAFSLRNAADEPLVSWIAASCPAMCGFVLANDECGCPDIGCTPGVLRIAPGGAILVDDFHNYGGSRTATEEFLRERQDFRFQDSDNVLLWKSGGV